MVKKKLQSFTKKERKGYLKDLRHDEESKGKAKSYLIKAVLVLVGVFIVGLIVYVFVAPSTPGPKSILGEEIPEQGRNHISQGSTQHGPYNSNPPTSGPHWPQPAQCKIYTEEIADESVIHSLEHGAVWVTYKDNGELGDNLTALVENNSTKVILSPRSENDSAVAVVSWGRILKLEGFDEQQIDEFINVYRNSGPEPFAPC